MLHARTLAAAALLAVAPALGLAGTLAIDFKTPAGTKAEFKKVTVDVYHVDPAKKGAAPERLKSFTSTESTFSSKIENAAEGLYFVQAYTGEEDQMSDATRPGAFSTLERFALKADENKSVTIEYVAFDPATLKGDLQASGELTGFDGKPAAGREVRAVVATKHAGFYPVATVKTDDKGAFSFSGLAKETDYTVMLGEDTELGTFTAGTQKGKLSYALVPGTGDMAPDVTFQYLSDGKPSKLSDFKGKVVVVDFWATWCGPCQAPMAKMNTYREHHPEWGDKVELIALSVDETKDVIDKHIEKKGWKQVTHMWTGTDAFEGDAPKKYGVNSIPTLLILDQSGKIAYRGHPMGTETSKVVAELLGTKEAPAAKEKKGG